MYYKTEVNEMKTNGKSRERKDEIRNIYMVSHPVRNSILSNLDKHEKDGTYPTKIAKEIEQERELVSFHLLKLENAGIVEGEYGLKNPEKNPPRAVKYYKLTRKGKNIYNKINEIL